MFIIQVGVGAEVAVVVQFPDVLAEDLAMWRKKFNLKHDGDQPGFCICPEAGPPVPPLALRHYIFSEGLY